MPIGLPDESLPPVDALLTTDCYLASLDGVVLPELILFGLLLIYLLTLLL